MKFNKIWLWEPGYKTRLFLIVLNERTWYDLLLEDYLKFAEKQIVLAVTIKLYNLNRFYMVISVPGLPVDQQNKLSVSLKPVLKNCPVDKNFVNLNPKIY